jgi:hypothetical protein
MKHLSQNIAANLGVKCKRFKYGCMITYCTIPTHHSSENKPGREPRTSWTQEGVVDSLSSVAGIVSTGVFLVADMSTGNADCGP